MKQKKVFALAGLLLSIGLLQLQAQNNSVTAGGDASGSGGSISYSIGQVDYIQATGSGGTANQGVQQPIEIYVLGNDEFSNIELSAVIFPNPTSNYVTLSINDMYTNELSFTVVDVNGRKIMSEQIRSAQTIVPFEHLQASMYLLSVMNGNSLLKTFKIIKN